MSEPSNPLPSYLDPPVNEVAIALQFEDIDGFALAYGPFYERVRKELPLIEEQDPILPTFETFASPFESSGSQILLNQAPSGKRLWCISDDGHKLVQIQPNRIVQNWRKRKSEGTYPRFERVLKEFWKNFDTLEQVLSELGRPSIKGNQCEINYFNHIKLVDGETFTEASARLLGWPPVRNCTRNLEGHRLESEAALSRYSMLVTDEANSAPRARLMVTTQPAMDGETRKEFLQLSLTCRGVPPTNNRDGINQFMLLGREAIVRTFTDLTSKECHKLWGREK